MEFDPDATVETVVINEGEVTEELTIEVTETISVEITDEVSEALEEVTPESDEKSDQAK
jgi:segregation and condensation protein B